MTVGDTVRYEAELRTFIVDELGWQGSPALLTDDYALVANDVIDSLGIFELVTFIEDHYQVEIDDEELVLENFETLGAMGRLLRSKALV